MRFLVAVVLLLTGAACQTSAPATSPSPPHDPVLEMLDDVQHRTFLWFCAEQLYLAADWSYFFTRAPLVSMSWRPERGFSRADWRGLNEAPILCVLALASPTHPVDPAAWDAWTSTYMWLTFYGQEHINFAPLFGHQYSHVWIDFRGIQDEYLRQKGIDLFQNARRATISQRAYAIDNPNRWKDYSENVWGLTACDGPGGGKLTVDGTERQFWGYMAQGAAAAEIRDDGTIAPTAAAASIAFAPEIVIPAIAEMKMRYGDKLCQRYVWDVMKKNPHIIRGLWRAGFRGGWLD